MAASSNGNGSWKGYAIATLTSILLTGLVAWFTFGSDKVTQTQVHEIIRQSSPYNQDRRLILNRMDRLEDIDDRLKNIEIALAVLVNDVEKDKRK